MNDRDPGLDPGLVPGAVVVEIPADAIVVVPDSAPAAPTAPVLVEPDTAASVDDVGDIIEI